MKKSISLIGLFTLLILIFLYCTNIYLGPVFYWKIEPSQALNLIPVAPVILLLMLGIDYFRNSFLEPNTLIFRSGFYLRSILILLSGIVPFLIDYYFYDPEFKSDEVIFVTLAITFLVLFYRITIKDYTKLINKYIYSIYLGFAFTFLYLFYHSAYFLILTYLNNLDANYLDNELYEVFSQFVSRLYPIAPMLISFLIPTIFTSRIILFKENK